MWWDWRSYAWGFSLPVPELWLSVDNWEMEWDRERRPALVGRVLNSCIWSVNWICYRDPPKKNRRQDENGFMIDNSTHPISFLLKSSSSRVFISLISSPPSGWGSLTIQDRLLSHLKPKTPAEGLAFLRRSAVYVHPPVRHTHRSDPIHLMVSNREKSWERKA